MSRTPLIAIAPLLLAALLALAWGCGTNGSPERAAEGHDRGAGHEEGHDHGHDEAPAVRLDDAARARLGLQMAEAGPAELEITVELPGEVQVNGDRLAHVGPRVGGVARRVLVSLGDRVREGQLMAVLDSRELADSKAAYLAAAERLRLAEATHRREERLWQERVSSEQDYLDASNALAEARIALRAAEKTLHVLGFDEDEVDRLDQEADSEVASYRITAPFDGEVVDRHITVGETIPAEESVFTVADLATVWVDLAVHQRDLARVAAGQRVRVRSSHDGVEGVGTIRLVQPLLGEQTRTALARVTLPNPDRRWQAGAFVTATVTVDTSRADLAVPRTALIRMGDGDDVVFVETDRGFEPRPVELGRSSPDAVEVRSGLAPGDRYVAAGGFSLKAELGKGSFGDGHGH